MFISSIHLTIKIEIASDAFVDVIFKSIKNKYEDLNNHMERSEFRFEFVSKLDIRCEKVNIPKGSSFIQSYDWLRYKNATVYPQNIDDKYFQYASAHSQHHKEIKNHRK